MAGWCLGLGELRCWHRRRNKLCMYLLTILICVGSMGMTIVVLWEYITQKRRLEKHYKNITIHSRPFIGIAAYNMFNGFFVGSVFSLALFSDMCWSDQPESPAGKLAWRVFSAFACLSTLVSAVCFTIVSLTKSVYMAGADLDTILKYLEEMKGVGGWFAMEHRQNLRMFAAAMMLWPGFVAALASTVPLWLGGCHTHGDNPRPGYLESLDRAAARREARIAARRAPQQDPQHRQPDIELRRQPGIELDDEIEDTMS
ncbi:hypothetical protein BDV95DRAFT_260483 [Massariosphaeria phaeospora]|uniref:Transmembrane protein n=1 Tax=Massariosphaeria phaeospora TaxID=100035 RepID=A0A7C8HYP9_9PLEO|nr:hypothetical protein BDV95DRAFT_260483 [Massariosphaeria phaeospora]